MMAGCAWKRYVPFMGPKPSASKEVVSIQVIREDLWRTGGPIAILPFVPGDRVEAGRAFDRAALMIIKGASDTFASGGSHFLTVTDNSAASAMFVMEGGIDRFEATRKWWKCGLGKKKIVIRIKAQVYERRTGEVVALVFVYKTARGARITDKITYDLGCAIARKMGR